MTTVSTVLGKTTADKLGKTLIHEHALIGYPGWFLDRRQPPFRRDDALARVTDAFAQLKDYGVETVVDPCPGDLGRDVEFYAEISQRSGVNLICASGVYFQASGITFTLGVLDVEAITEIFIKEIEEGVGETGIRPGIVKIATGYGEVTKYERKVLTAAARAAKATGTPVLSHTEACTCGHDQIDIVTGEGVSCDHLLIGHTDGTEDLDYQVSIAERGVYVGFDRFGLEDILPDAIRMKHLKALVDRGYRDQLMMSHDTVNCWLATPPRVPPGADLRETRPNWHMTHIFENIIPELKRMGMTDADFDVILRDNPARFFGVNEG